MGQFSRPLPLLWPPCAPTCAPPRSPPRSPRVPGGGMLSPLSYGVHSTPPPRANGEYGVARERYVPPLYPLAPTHSNRTWVWGSPLSPAPLYARKGVRQSMPQPPSPSFLRAKRPHSHLYPLPVCLRRGCKDGPPHGRRARDCTRPIAAQPPSHLPLPPQGEGTTGRGRWEGGCAAMGHVWSLGGALPPSAPHPASCANGECRVARKGTPSPPSHPLVMPPFVHKRGHCSRPNRARTQARGTTPTPCVPLTQASEAPDWGVGRHLRDGTSPLVLPPWPSEQGAQKAARIRARTRGAMRGWTPSRRGRHPPPIPVRACYGVHPHARAMGPRMLRSGLAYGSTRAFLVRRRFFRCCSRYCLRRCWVRLGPSVGRVYVLGAEGYSGRNWGNTDWKA